MKYYEHNTNYVNGTWFGLSRGLMLSILPVLGQLVFATMYVEAKKRGQHKTAYCSLVALITTFIPWLLILFVL